LTTSSRNADVEDEGLGRSMYPGRPSRRGKGDRAAAYVVGVGRSGRRASSIPSAPLDLRASDVAVGVE